MSKGATVLMAAGLLLVFCGAGAIQAQEGGGYRLDWWTVDGGGAAASGGEFTLVGTAGQPEAAPAASGEGYSLAGGFWAGGDGVRYEIYLPIVLRGAG